jgi:hypothetical protein
MVEKTAGSAHWPGGGENVEFITVLKLSAIKNT